VRWRKHYYVDLALPFGLRSSPYIFNSVADMVEWILLHTHNVSALLHYLEDFSSPFAFQAPLGWSSGGGRSQSCHGGLCALLMACGSRLIARPGIATYFGRHHLQAHPLAMSLTTKLPDVSAA